MLKVKMMGKILFFLSTDYGVLKVLFTILCSFWIFQDFYIAFIERPTLTSHITGDFKFEDFPDIMLCPEPPIDVSLMQSLGYVNYYKYNMGYGQHNDGSSKLSKSWVGNSSLDVKDLFKKISTLETAKDCPRAKIVYYHIIKQVI